MINKTPRVHVEIVGIEALISFPIDVCVWREWGRLGL